MRARWRRGEPLDELQEAQAPATHLQEHQAVAPARNVGLAVGAGLVANRDFHGAQLQARGAEEQVEIAEGVLVAELVLQASEALPVSPRERLGAAERVF